MDPTTDCYVILAWPAAGGRGNPLEEMVQSTVKRFCLFISQLSSHLPGQVFSLLVQLQQQWAPKIGYKPGFHAFSRKCMEVAIAWTGELSLGTFMLFCVYLRHLLLLLHFVSGYSTSILSLTALEQWSPIPTTLDGIKASEEDTQVSRVQLQQSYILIIWPRNHSLCFSSVPNQLWESLMEELRGFLSSQSFSKLTYRYSGLLTGHVKKHRVWVMLCFIRLYYSV